MPEPNSPISPDVEAELMALLAKRGQSADPLQALRGASSIGPTSPDRTRDLPEYSEKQQPDMIAKILGLLGMDKPLEQMGGPASAMVPAAAAARNPLLRAVTRSAKPAAKAAAPLKSVENSKSTIARMNQESAAGYRNVPTATNPLLDLLPEGGLNTITPDEWKKLGMRQVKQDVPAHMSDQGWGEDLLQELLSREKRLTIPGRAKAYRANTPYSE